jgi:hypothetical protein
MKKVENREVERHQMFSDLSVVYEGSTEEIQIQLPDLSTRGMFIPTRQLFPLGSVLKVQFRLPRSNFHVEFPEISAEALQAIEKELGL